MTKKYFSDGLVQIAIVLSLLRTDLNEYFNNIVNDYSIEGTGVHEVIVGSGTTAYTQSDLYGNIGYSDLSTSIHPKHIDNYIGSVFRELHSLGGYGTFANTNIDAYLVGESNSESSSPVADNTAQGSINIATGDNNIHDNAAVPTSHDNTSENDSTSRQSTIGSSDLTAEDMDLIEILWRQDIDMGVSRETFDGMVQEDRKKEIDVSKSKEEKTETSTDSSSDAVNYVIDMETGEQVPTSQRRNTPEVSIEPMVVDSHVEENNAIHFDELNISFNLEDDLLEARERTYSGNSIFPDEDLLPIEGNNDEVSPIPVLSYSRQVSLEARWTDVQRLIIGEARSSPVSSTITSETQFVKSNDSMDSNSAVGNSTTGNEDVWLQNATFAAQDNSFNVIQPLEENNILPLNLNESQPLFPTNTSEDILSSLFPNATGMDPDEDVLDDLLSEINDPEDEETELLMRKLEDADSAVGSWGSIGSASPFQDFGDTHSDLTSPFDGLEGATGGHELDETDSKYSSSGQSYTFSTIEWESPTSAHTNHTYSNDSSDFGYTPADLSKVSHDHSYPLKPGQEPRENKKLLKEEERRIALSRDERKAKALKIPFTVDDIIHSSVEKFNDLLTKYRLSDAQLRLVKDIRRRGKNKVAAQNCRKRKMEVIEDLEDSVLRMKQEKEHFNRQRIYLERERNEIREKYSGLYRDVFRTLRDENGQPYNPNEYMLQHTSDGNVFLVPKQNSTGADDPEYKETKKRKGRRK